MGGVQISCGVRLPHKSTRMRPKHGVQNARDGVDFVEGLWCVLEVGGVVLGAVCGVGE